MAAAQLAPQNGAVAFPGSLVADYGSFEIGESQATESVACYGAAVYDNYRGSGTPHTSISAAGFAKAHASSTVPFGTGGGLTVAAGAAATFTIDTGVTYAGSFVVTSVRLMHARLRAAIPLTWSLEISGDPTVTWATS